jgi:hypothetical protein
VLISSTNVRNIITWADFPRYINNVDICIMICSVSFMNCEELDRLQLYGELSYHGRYAGIYTAIDIDISSPKFINIDIEP